MATSPADDIHTQLAGLLGKRSTDIMHIRMTHEDPPAISVIDVVQVITGMAKNNAGNYVERMKTTHPEVSTNPPTLGRSVRSCLWGRGLPLPYPSPLGGQIRHVAEYTRKLK